MKKIVSFGLIISAVLTNNIMIGMLRLKPILTKTCTGGQQQYRHYIHHSDPHIISKQNLVLEGLSNVTRINQLLETVMNNEKTSRYDKHFLRQAHELLQEHYKQLEILADPYLSDNKYHMARYMPKECIPKE